MSDDTPPAALLTAAADVTLILDDAGTVCWADPSLPRVLGYAPETIEGDDLLAYAHADDREALAAALEQVVDTGPEAAERVEHRFRAASGDTVWLESRLAALPDDDAAGPVLTAREVTERKRVERERLREIRRLRQITDHAGDVLFTFDASFSALQFVNDAYAEVWGQSPAELAADPTALVEGAHPEDRGPLLDELDVLVGGESIDTEFRVNPDEDYGRWVRLQGTPIEADGEVTRLVAVAHDVTRRRERERQVRAMDRMLRHNLRNDLNVVLGHADQLAARTDFDRGAATNLRRIVEHSESLLSTAGKARHIVDLLGPEAAIERIDVAAVARRAVDAAATANPWADLSVDAPESATARCASKLPLAVTELLDNALTHTDGSTATVAVTVDRTPDRVTLTVVDDGPPIPDVERGAVAGERDVTQIEHGSGLGLWLVAWIARCSDGSVQFDTHADGNEVTLRFPRAT